MTWKRTVLAGGLFLVIACVSVALSISIAEHQEKVRRENAEKIVNGMYKADVIALIGKPDYAPGTATPSFLGGTLSSMRIEAEGSVWQFSDQRLYVVFDSDDNASGLMRTYGMIPKDSVLDKVRRYLII